MAAADSDASLDSEPIRKALAVLDIGLLHIDAALLVVDKPGGLLSVPGRGPERQDCLISRIQSVIPEALIVHRLDMETSGLLVIARGAATHRELSRQFRERGVEKRYVALVDGTPQPSLGIIDLPLIADWPNRPRQMVDHLAGKPSLTRYSLERSDGDTSRVTLEPVTGRSHQLRVHMLAIGHPILGDALYAPENVLARSDRLLLHATFLALTHPIHGRRVAFHSPPPF